MQAKLDKIMNNLKEIYNKSKDMANKVDKHIKEEIVNEMLFYITKNDKNK